MGELDDLRQQWLATRDMLVERIAYVEAGNGISPITEDPATATAAWLRKMRTWV
jgi:hypothetical protein